MALKYPGFLRDIGVPKDGLNARGHGANGSRWCLGEDFFSSPRNKAILQGNKKQSKELFVPSPIVFLQNLCLTLPKFNSSPLKSYRNPIGKACLPTIIFQGRAVKLRGGKHFFLGEI